MIYNRSVYGFRPIIPRNTDKLLEEIISEGTEVTGQLARFQPRVSSCFIKKIPCRYILITLTILIYNTTYFDKRMADERFVLTPAHDPNHIFDEERQVR